MREKKLKSHLRESLNCPVSQDRADLTVRMCMAIVAQYSAVQKEERTGFWGYLSDIFRFEGPAILGQQAVVLFITCIYMTSITAIPEGLPACMPLFALAAIPTLFRGQTHKMCEIEAVTRASGAQVMLAKLILAGAANLVCLTVLLPLELYLQTDYGRVGQIILYALVPYLVCMVFLLRQIRICKRGSVVISTAVILVASVGWGMTSFLFPWLYETSAVGIWLIAFLIFGSFFVKEIAYVIKMWKEGKMYGIVT